MTRLRRIIAVFSILSFGLIASLVSDSQLAAGGDETQDARAYARSFGVPVDEALRRLRLQPNAGMLQQLLLEQEAATFAGLWIDNGSPYRVFAGFTRDGDRVLPSYAAAAGLRGIVVAVQASYSLNELNRDLKHGDRAGTRSRRRRERQRSRASTLETIASIFLSSRRMLYASRPSGWESRFRQLCE